MPLVLVHGGGKPIDRAMAEAGLRPRKVQGRRYTDDATLAIVVRVLLKEINAGIEAQIRQLGGRAVGQHLGSFQYLFGERLRLPGPDGGIDLGRVGTVTRADTALIQDFCFIRRRRALHVLNAPSPAATASLAIGEEIAVQIGPDLSQ